MADVHELLAHADALAQRGESAGARVAYERVLAAAPRHPEAAYGLARLALRDGDAVEAIARFRDVLAVTPEHTAARAQLAAASLATGDVAGAAREVAVALAALPHAVPLRLLAAKIALRQDDLAGAVAHCRAGLAVEPRHAPLLETLAHALRSSGALTAATEAFAAAAAAAPDDPARWLACGNACMEAELARVGAARARPDAAQAAGEADFLAGALHAFGRAATLAPAEVAPWAHQAMAARYACDWPRARTAMAALVARYAAGPDRFACSPMMAVALLEDPHAQRAAIAGWSRATLPPSAAPAIIARRGTVLRVGYLSSDFHDHATAHLAAGMFELHDRGRVEAFAYAADGDDGSAMRRRLRAAFPHWRDVRTLPDDEAARVIARDALDVLVDLKGHTHGARLPILAQRPAPVQLHYLGFPGTLACGAIDGFVADAITAPPGADDEFAEPILRLPVCYQVNDAKRPVPAPSTRAAVGLPERALVLASFNQTYKLTDGFFAAWLAVLREHDDAVLWLTVPHALARRNLQACADEAGVARDRIAFAPVLPVSEHIARLTCADLALDVLPYGSHTTGSDALWAGVPLLTCRGTTFAGRVGASLCAAVGMPELVTESPAQYAEVLRALCADRARLVGYRRHLEAGRTTLPLFDTAAFTRAFERMLESAANGVGTR